MFDVDEEPTTTVTTDPTDYELGMRFTANVAGTITELRYFRGAADASDTDTRVLNLWNAAGVLLGSVTVTSTAGELGWQVGTLSAPIAIEAGATYVVSYGTTQNYAATANYFNTAHSGPDGVLTAGVASGVFAAGTPGVFPTATYNASNYWADVTFVPHRQHARRSSPRPPPSPRRRTARSSAPSPRPTPTPTRSPTRSPAGPTPRSSPSTPRPACCASSARRTTRPRPTRAPTTSTT